ncbi:MAG TPA: hypothetical protein VE980_20800, partial [Pyrinomonadaceae bacterium]|nr:hypothetical protein [Pyrinomonadaceae bacterium]
PLRALRGFGLLGMEDLPSKELETSHLSYKNKPQISSITFQAFARSDVGLGEHQSEPAEKAIRIDARMSGNDENLSRFAGIRYGIW